MLAVRAFGDDPPLPPFRPLAQIERVAPNPAHTDVAVEFALGGKSAQLELVDLAGRMIETMPLAGFGAGRHVVSVPLGRCAPGIYWVRLREGDRVDARRIAVLP
jgi:hypothetical protein